MIRNLKALGLALVAVFAMSALVAQAASAQDLFTSDSSNGKTILTGTTEPNTTRVFESETGGAKVECEQAHFTGTVNGNSVSSVTVHPIYTNCTAPGIGNATVNTNGCDYILTGETDSTQDATISIECTTGSSITVTIPGVCTLHFGAQGPLRGVHYTNGTENNKGDVTVKATVHGIHYTKTGSFCFLVPGNGEEGYYEESITVTGFEDDGGTQNSTTHVWENVQDTTQVNISVS